jgi:hypothetical protein
VAVYLDVYNATNTTHLGTLTQAYAIGFLDDLVVPGAATFKVDVASTADMALLTPRRVVRFRTGGSAGTGDLAAFVVQDRPAELAADIEPSAGATHTVVTFQCPALLSWMGYQQGGATLWPYGGLSGRQQNPRVFGWYTDDFDDTGWTDVTGALVSGPLSTAGWPDPKAVGYVPATAGGLALYRRRVAASASAAGPARCYAVATWDTALRVWIDGDLVITKKVGETGLFTADVEYDDTIDHMIAVEAEGGSGRWGFTWVKLTATVDADGNDVITLGSTLRRTFDPAVFPATTPWKTFEVGSGDVPGVTVGYVAKTAIDEAKARGDLSQVTYNFTAAADSSSGAWAVEFSRGFRMQELGLLLDELTSIEGEVSMSPAGVLSFHKERGTDRTATVTVSSPFSLGLSGRGPQATRWLFETAGGFGQIVNAAAETSLGVRMEQFVQLGTDLSPSAVQAMLVPQLVADGGTLDEIEVDLPDSVVPYTHVFLGDRVMCAARSGTAAVRIVAFEGQVDDANGRVEWSARAVPV